MGIISELGGVFVTFRRMHREPYVLKCLFIMAKAKSKRGLLLRRFADLCAAVFAVSVSALRQLFGTPRDVPHIP